ncbi:hypothetical protein BDN72DRAFT_964062 [Pluteus cervinus]|uniref:Uncharacterized protein n=1 Tax=Pluteus cervinus TaxID=181527 RepID=A0ACD3AD15_9AGAR|nr:hypothetical protein BDN72DRAFT_964062 [Pluteus cervinus]
MADTKLTVSSIDPALQVILYHIIDTRNEEQQLSRELRHYQASKRKHKPGGTVANIEMTKAAIANCRKRRQDLEVEAKVLSENFEALFDDLPGRDEHGPPGTGDGALSASAEKPVEASLRLSDETRDIEPEKAPQRSEEDKTPTIGSPSALPHPTTPSHSTSTLDPAKSPQQTGLDIAPKPEEHAPPTSQPTSKKRLRSISPEAQAPEPIEGNNAETHPPAKRACTTSRAPESKWTDVSDDDEVDLGGVSKGKSTVAGVKRKAEDHGRGADAREVVVDMGEDEEAKKARKKARRKEKRQRSKEKTGSGLENVEQGKPELTPEEKQAKKLRRQEKKERRRLREEAMEKEARAREEQEARLREQEESRAREKEERRKKKKEERRQREEEEHRRREKEEEEHRQREKLAQEQKAREKAKREKEEKVKRAKEEKAKREAEEKAKREAEEKAKRTMTTSTSGLRVSDDEGDAGKVGRVVPKSKGKKKATSSDDDSSSGSSGFEASKGLGDGDDDSDDGDDESDELDDSGTRRREQLKKKTATKKTTKSEYKGHIDINDIKWKGSLEEQQESLLLYKKYLDVHALLLPALNYEKVSNKDFDAYAEAGRLAIKVFARAQDPTESVPLPPKFRKALRDIQDFLPACSTTSRTLTLHILITSKKNTWCMYHWPRPKRNTIRKKPVGFKITGFADTNDALSCGCATDTACLEFIIYKRWLAVNRNGDKERVTLFEPRAREFILQNLKSWSLFRLDDLYNDTGFGWDDLQILKIRRTQRDNHQRTINEVKERLRKRKVSFEDSDSEEGGYAN